jgi:two-component system nitrogen regulation response regulator NtrX
MRNDKAPDSVATILIVDDDAEVRKDLTKLLQPHGYHCLESSDGKMAMECLKQQDVDLLLLDLRLPRLSGIEVLKRCRENDPDLPVIMISGHGTIAQAVEATKLGAFDFLEKPLHAERTLVTIRNAVEKRRLKRQRDSLLREARQQFQMLGSTPKMLEIFRLLERAAKVDSKVIIYGESGTGKELVARNIHFKSTRAGFPFVPINCSAIPETLVESTFFGNVRGAFTGATNRQGKFQQANRGTLFLDEIGDMSLMMQAKLLRVIEDGVIEPLGSNAATPVELRLIAATCKDLKTEMNEGNFRADLFFRLNVLTIFIPPLRERKDDIPLLAESILQKICATQGLPNLTFAPEARPVLQDYHWPGNVRELNNVMERAALLAEGEAISASILSLALQAEPQPVLANISKAQTLYRARDQFEKEFIQQILLEHGGKIQETAEALGIQRSHLWKKMQQHKIAKMQ